MKDWTPEEWYQDGAAFAKEVQEALASGKTWQEIESEMDAATPEEAAHIRDVHQQHQSERAPWWEGYVSRWD